VGDHEPQQALKGHGFSRADEFISRRRALAPEGRLLCDFQIRRGEVNMNLREGTRRLALLLGAAGAIVGGFASYSEIQTIRGNLASHIRFEQLAASPVAQRALDSLKSACAQDPSEKQCGDEKYAPMSEVNSGDIKTIYWSKDYRAELIQSDDGQNLFSTKPVTTAWEYLLVALLPVFGFMVPWGAVLAIGWVGAGFIKPAN
jgi:hypothetical protein